MAKKKKLPKSVKTKKGEATIRKSSKGDTVIHIEPTGSKRTKPKVQHTFGIGESLSEGWTLLLRHAGFNILPLYAIYMLAAIFSSGWKLPDGSQPSGWGPALAGTYGLSLENGQLLFNPTEFGSFIIITLLAFYGALIPIVTALITLKGEFYSETKTLSKIYKHAIPLLLYFLFTGLLSFTVQLIAYLIGYFFYIINAKSIAGLIFIFLSLFGRFAILTTTSMGSQAILNEELGPWQGFKVSLDYSLHYLWQIFAILVLTGFFSELLSGIIMFSLSGTSNLYPFLSQNLIITLFKGLEVSAITYAYWKIDSFPR